MLCSLFQCEELKKEVKEEHSQWVAQYLVMKRASIEPNFHTLYTNFIDALNIQEITQMVVLETFRNIKVLKQPLKNRHNKDSLMQVKSTTECSMGAFCNTFDLY